MVDIETPDSPNRNEETREDDASFNIIRMGFSNSLGSGISFPYEGAYIARARDAVKRAKTVLFWHKDYDLPRLRAAGFELRSDVVIIDAMWSWHYFQSDLPKSLAFASPFFYSGPAWKHLSGERPAYYNAMDNARQMANWQGIKLELQRNGQLDRFMRQCLVEPILVKMGRKGVGVDVEKRSKFMQALQNDAARELESIREQVPSTLGNVKTWKKGPKVKLEGDLVLAEGGMSRQLPFNPGSSPQLKKLISHYKLKMPIKRGTDRETAEKKYLLRFGKKYPVFTGIVKYKEKCKLTSTYNWPLNMLMRATSTYGYWPSTWRLASRKVNLQNIPKRSDLAKSFRQMLIAKPGYVLLEADWSAIEAVLVGYSAGSQSYINLAKAGVHGWLSSHIIKQPIDWRLPLDELTKQCKLVKRANPIIYEAAKRIVHGSNYLLSPYGMYDEYEELFSSRKEPEQMQKLYFALEPGKDVRKWQERQINFAHKSKYLDNHFNFRHYFYELYKYNSRAKRFDLGDDAKRAVAFVPQSDAAFMQRELFLLMDQENKDFTELLELPTHDSIVAEVRPNEIGEASRMLYKHMTRCWPELDGLSIGVELKVGSNLAEQEEISVTL
jgi:DNA polymerase I-like protein with 3'-5' exonuclease and polymerase domains